ncbi:hypothetical protein CEXT_663171 [Caerostris extrusa]|uniref:Uncharacterized protein n=1 Tax=Caerostris extrusa TaxID=172846 RepID=A0AAV4R0C2_CAEEX|nr:hypothetical protein CEXT_663171 [Caerostris extrusa]
MRDLELTSFQWIRAQNFEGGFGSSKHMDYEQSGRWYQWVAGPTGVYAVPDYRRPSYYEQSENTCALSSTAFSN